MNDETARFHPEDIFRNKGMACISYLGILFIIPLLANRTSPFVKFHINQGLMLFIVSTIGNIIGMVLRHVPLVGWIVPTAVSIATLVLAILGVVQTLQGRAVRLPIIGNVEIYK